MDFSAKRWLFASWMALVLAPLAQARILTFKYACTTTDNVFVITVVSNEEKTAAVDLLLRLSKTHSVKTLDPPTEPEGIIILRTMKGSDLHTYQRIVGKDCTELLKSGIVEITDDRCVLVPKAGIR